MADYHCSVKAVSRAKGRSATAAAAYRSASRIEDERTGEVHDYTRKGGVVHTALVLPAEAPEWAANRAQLWNAAEKAEARKDAKVAREWEIAIPHELAPEARTALVMEYARHLSDRYGIAVDVAIHEPGRGGDERNHHAHLLGTTRTLGRDGLAEKTRVLDSPKTSGPEVEACREAWAEMCNRSLERAQVAERVDHRSLKAQQAEAAQIAGDMARAAPERQQAEAKAQALDREPTMHLGPTVAAMERRGAETERGDMLRQVRERNGIRQHLREIGGKLAQHVAALGERLEGAMRAIRTHAAEVMRPQREGGRVVEIYAADVLGVAQAIYNDRKDGYARADAAYAETAKSIVELDKAKPQPPRLFGRKAYEVAMGEFEKQRAALSRTLAAQGEERRAAAEALPPAFKPRTADDLIHGVTWSPDSAIWTEAERRYRATAPASVVATFDTVKAQKVAERRTETAEKTQRQKLERDVDSTIKDFRDLAAKRHAGRRGYRDEDPAWTNAPQALKERVEAWNRQPFDRVEAAAKGMRAELLADAGKRDSLKQQVAQVLGLSRGRGLGR